MAVRTESVETVVIGGGQAGLSLSRRLTDLGREHVVLERGRVAERWRSERWDSFTLLTPNWHTRLPGRRYEGDDPDGFLDRDGVVAMFEGYAGSFAAPVRTGVEVDAVEPVPGGGWRVRTSEGTLAAANVVVATGHYATPLVPLTADAADPRIAQVHTSRYRNPEALPPGAVVVVGGGASGIQIADELHRSGRQVMLSLGRHHPLPRRYRGHDVIWWLEQMGRFDETVDDVHDLHAARHAPSLALTGDTHRAELDIRQMAREGVVLLGRTQAVDGGVLSVAPDLEENLAAADRRYTRFVESVDRFVDETGLDVPGPDSRRLAAGSVATHTTEQVDLVREGVGAIVWATGYRPDYSIVRAPVLDGHGEVIQRRGVTPAAGLYFLGLRWMHTRTSNFIDGVGRDAEYVAAHLAARATARLAA